MISNNFYFVLYIYSIVRSVVKCRYIVLLLNFLVVSGECVISFFPNVLYCSTCTMYEFHWTLLTISPASFVYNVFNFSIEFIINVLLHHLHESGTACNIHAGIQ